MTKILFVCHGNICRSPIAEFMLRDMARKAGIDHRLEIASAAVSREELGNPMYPPAKRVLQAHGIPFGNHRARQITQADLSYYHRIYYMDSRNRQYLDRLFPGHTNCFPLLSHDVADPWYTGDFTATWEDLSAGCAAILQEVL